MDILEIENLVSAADPGGLEPFHAVGAILPMALGFDLAHRNDGIDAPDPGRVRSGKMPIEPISRSPSLTFRMTR